MNIVIIGAGSFGTALAQVLLEKKENNVILYSNDKEVVQTIKKNAINEKYFPKYKLNKKLEITNSFLVLKTADIIIFAIPSNAILQICKKIKKYITTQKIILTSKGISKEGLLLSEIIENTLNIPSNQVFVLSGPNIAKELIKLKPTSIVIGGDIEKAKTIKNIFDPKLFVIKITSDKKGIQLLGFYKNLISILVGICDGLKLGNNFTATLITKAYSELYYLNQNKNIKRHSFIDYAGLGDLYVTSTSLNSRNRNFGKLLTENYSIIEIQKKIGQVIEGYDNLLILLKISNKLKKKNIWFDINLLETIDKISKSKNKEEKKQLLYLYLQSSNIKAIIFDWGNVLTKTYYTKTVAENISKFYGYEEKKVFELLEKKEKKALIGKDTFEDFFKKIKKNLPKIKKQKIKQIYFESILWNENMLNLCKKLHLNYDVYILSNNYSWITPIIKEKLKTITTKQFYSNEIGLTKSSYDCFTFFLQENNLRSENCIFIDDNIKNIINAKNLGFHTIHHNSQKNSIQELQKIIKK